MKKSFLIYTEIWPAVQKLDMEQRGQLLTAMMQHALGEPVGKLDILVDVVFSFIAAQMDRADEKYQEICARRAEYGRRGGLAKATKSKQKLANVADSDSEPDSDSDSDSERDSDSEAASGRGVSLSAEDRETLDLEFGAERVTELIEEVKLWAANNDRTIKDWPSMVRTFAKNQQRWSPAKSRDVGKLVDVAFDKWVAEQEGAK